MLLDTNKKVMLATLLSTLIRSVRSIAGLTSTVNAQRRNISWYLDLKEGIDLAIYIFGGFELNTRRFYKKKLTSGSVIIDIGANMGAHTLPLAQIAGSIGKVIALEPTQFAFGKLQKNLALNPLLSSQVIPLQIMLVAESSINPDKVLYSSWPVDGSNDVHSTLRGRLMETTGCEAKTLDQVIDELPVSHVDFIKLDVDGHELDVLRGSQYVLANYSPRILMELAPYVYENSTDFDQILELMWGYGYDLENIDTNKKLPQDINAVKRQIPSKGSINVWGEKMEE